MPDLPYPSVLVLGNASELRVGVGATGTFQSRAHWQGTADAHTDGDEPLGEPWSLELSTDLLLVPHDGHD